MSKQQWLISVLLILVLMVGYLSLRKITPSNLDNSNQPGNGNVTIGNSLDLSNKGLIKLPNYVLNMTNLETLDLSHNQLTGALPAEIRQLKNLKILNISNNSMTGIPAEIGQLSNLQTLDLSNNKFTGLPNELGNLKNLRTLNLSGNQYAKQDLEIIKQGLSSTVTIITD